LGLKYKLNQSNFTIEEFVWWTNYKINRNYFKKINFLQYVLHK